MREITDQKLIFPQKLILEKPIKAITGEPHGSYKISAANRQIYFMWKQLHSEINFQYLCMSEILFPENDKHFFEFEQIKLLL